MSDAPRNFNLEMARSALRSLQRHWSEQLEIPATDDAHEAATGRLSGDLAAQVEDGEWLRRGIFKYPKDLQRWRYELAQAILDRVQPGPSEDAEYVEMLALQAASVEGYVQSLREAHGHEEWSAGCRNVLIGTTREPRSEARCEESHGFALVLLSAGMLDFLYQCAKSVVLARPQTAPPKGAALRFSDKSEDIEAVLEADPYPIELLRDTMRTWLYEGIPRAPKSTMPRDVYHPPLGLLIDCAERFVLAHEYGHALFDQLGLGVPPEWQLRETHGIQGQWARESRADLFALDMLNQSAWMFDLLPTNIAYQGAALAMKAHELFDRALSICFFGEVRARRPSTTHPPFNVRASMMERFYEEGHPDKRRLATDLKGLTVPSRILERLWQGAAPDLLAESGAGRRLHPIWAGHSRAGFIS